MDSARHDKYLGFFYAITSSLSFGIMPVLAHFSYTFGSTTTTFLFFRFGISLVILSVYLYFTKTSIKTSLFNAIVLILTGLIIYTLTTQTLFLSYKYLGAGPASTLHFIYPMFVCILSYVFLRQPMGRYKILAILSGVAGLASFVVLDGYSIFNFGIFLAIFSGFLYSLEIIALSLKSIKAMDPKAVLFYIFISSTAGFFIYGVFRHDLTFVINWQLVCIYLVISLVCTIGSIVCFIKAIPLIGATSTSILGTFEFVVSIILGILLLHERMTLGLFVCGVFITISVLLLTLEKPKESGKEGRG